jgi:hypothetical protein
MPLWLFELACALVVVVTLRAMAKGRPARELAVDYASLSFAAYLGEESCISLYGHYTYAPGWHLRLHHVPLLVPLIWPLVVLSARDVVRTLAAGRLAGWAEHGVVALVVVLDASLVEVLSVRAGLWWWAEPGHLGVPLVGILGWGMFALGAARGLEAPLAKRPSRVLVLSLASTHGLLLASWWGLLRWVLRRDLDPWSTWAMGAVGLAALAVVLVVRRPPGRGLDGAVLGPRLAATGLFVVLFLLTARTEPRLVAHLAFVALPYVAASWPRAGDAARAH